MKKRFLSILLCFAMAVGLLPAAALAGVATAEDGSISYEPQEQGKNSNGGYTIDKISHPDLGAGEVDGILTGEDQDRGNSYSWSMADGGEDSDYIYIGTCYNSTFYIYHNNVKTSLNALKKEGKLPDDADTDTMATNIVEVMFGVDKFDETDMSDWDPVIISVHKKTGEAKVIFRERALWAGNPTIFPGYSPLLSVKNYLSGYRMVCEFEGKLYFAGMGNPTATLVEVDPATNTAKIAYYNIRYTKGVSNGVHGLMVYDGEILMCLATDDYDGNHTPGGIIMASSNPSDPESWRCIADQDSFDGLPGVMQVDGLNGGGIWDIIEYNGHLYVTIVTDKNIDGKINKQGFAMYRGDKDSKGDFTWTQVIGGKDGSKYGYGLGIDYSMSCNLWVYDGYLYLGTYNDPILNYFVDVPTDSYYYDAVLWGVEQGITNGTDDSHFDPNGLCTRAQAVTFLWRAAGSPAPKSTAMPFTDVPSGSYYETAVLWAVENGITKGTTDTTFSPDQSCTRGQIVTFLWRAESAPAAGTVDHPFTDVRSDAYYADAVLWAVKEGVTKGTSDTTFSPDDSCTRAQIVTFLWRAMAE